MLGQICDAIRGMSDNDLGLENAPRTLDPPEQNLWFEDYLDGNKT